MQAAGLDVTTVKDVEPAGPQRLPTEEAEGASQWPATLPQCKQVPPRGQKPSSRASAASTDKCGVERRSYLPGDHGRGRLRQSEYRLQLREKQKTGAATRCWRTVPHLLRTSSRQDGVTGENLSPACLESPPRQRASCASASPPRGARPASSITPRPLADQSAARVDIPSYQVRPGGHHLDQTVDSGCHGHGPPRDGTGLDRARLAPVPTTTPSTAKILRYPERSEILGAGPGVADRRAVLQVSPGQTRISEKKQRKGELHDH